MSINLEIQGFDDISSYLAGISEVDLRQLQEGIVELIRQDVMLRFQSSPTVETGGMVYGDVEWRALSEGYLANNPHRVGGQILIDTGTLKDSLTVKNAPYSVERYSEKSVEFGTDVPYAETQEKLGRKIVFLHPLLMNQITEFVQEFITTGNTIPKGT